MISGHYRLLDEDGNVILAYTKTLTSLINTITRTKVWLSEPFVPESGDDLANFIKVFERWCEANWSLGRLDPALIEANYGWVHLT